MENFVFDPTTYVEVPVIDGLVDDDRFFSREKTLLLIALYKKYKAKVGSAQVKTMKKVWELIARELNEKFHTSIAPNKCENKFKVLDRNFKKVTDNNNRTGRGRKVFEFEKEMEDLYEGRVNIRPQLLLTSNSVLRPAKDHSYCSTAEEIITPCGPSSMVTPLGSSSVDFNNIPSTSRAFLEIQEPENNVRNDEINQFATPTTSRINVEVESYRPQRNRNRTSQSYVRRNSILKEMKDDLKKYYEQRSERDKEKLELARRKQADREARTVLFREYVELLKENAKK